MKRITDPGSMATDSDIRRCLDDDYQGPCWNMSESDPEGTWSQQIDTIYNKDTRTSGKHCCGMKLAVLWPSSSVPIHVLSGT